MRHLLVGTLAACFVTLGAATAANSEGNTAHLGSLPDGHAAHARRSFGTFAGYVWPGHVSSVQASWSVQRMLGRSVGVASTWIGAQGPNGFIQVGTTEARAHGIHYTFYRAFWSDRAHHFHPVFLLKVHRGDRVSASLTLASGRWTVAILDRTTGQAARFSTADEAGGPFNLADWEQEDPSYTFRGKEMRSPYPRLAAVRIHNLKVNMAAPEYADLDSQWMSVNGGALAPTPLLRDSFSVRSATISRLGARYLAMVAPEDAATSRFVHEASEWTAATAQAQLAANTTTFATALRHDIQTLAAARWPKRVHQLVRFLLRRSRALLVQTQSPVPSVSAERAKWLAIWAGDAAAVGHAGHAIRRALRVPEIEPAN
jgi:hypothetical protein